MPALLTIGGVTQLRYNIDSLFRPGAVDFDLSCCALMIHISGQIITTSADVTLNGGLVGDLGSSTLPEG